MFTVLVIMLPEQLVIVKVQILRYSAGCLDIKVNNLQCHFLYPNIHAKRTVLWVNSALVCKVDYKIPVVHMAEGIKKEFL